MEASSSLSGDLNSSTENNGATTDNYSESAIMLSPSGRKLNKETKRRKPSDASDGVETVEGMFDSQRNNLSTPSIPDRRRGDSQGVDLDIDNDDMMTMEFDPLVSDNLNGSHDGSPVGGEDDGRADADIDGAEEGERLPLSDDADATVASLLKADEEEMINSKYRDAIPSIKIYFMERLKKFVTILGDERSHLQLKNVHVLVSIQKEGLVASTLNVQYLHNTGAVSKNRVEACYFLGLFPQQKYIKSKGLILTREQQFLIAMEFREKMLVSNQLIAYDGRCENFRFVDDSIEVDILPSLQETITTDDNNNNKSQVSQGTLGSLATSSDRGEEREKGYFSFGNTTVLSWGKIRKDDSFHSANHIYPIGFKCLRQELDTGLDRIVDCLIEVEELEIADESQTKSQKQKLLNSSKTIKVPLIRISVGWDINNKRVVRVYEGRSPVQCWQGILLEQIGLQENKDSNGEDKQSKKSGGDNIDIDVDVDSTDDEDEDSDENDEDDDYESMDEEEKSLREEIRREQKVLYRALSQSQRMGKQKAINPRLQIEECDGLVDEFITKMIEGMSGSLTCSNYNFVEARERNEYRKNSIAATQRVFTVMQNKIRSIVRTAKKQFPFALKNKDGVSFLTKTRKKRVTKADKAEEKRKSRMDAQERKAYLGQLQKSRNTRLRKFESAMTLYRNNFQKSLKKRKEEVEDIIESVGFFEEWDYSKKYHENAPGDAKTIPQPKNNLSRQFDGPSFTDVIEVWDFISGFGPKLGISEELKGFDVLVKALKRVDPLTMRVVNLEPGIGNSLAFAKKEVLTELDISEEDSRVYLDEIGVALTNFLVKDFESIFGIDQIVDPATKTKSDGDKSSTAVSGPSARVPVNLLTWREIARNVLMDGLLHSIRKASCDDIGNVISHLRNKNWSKDAEHSDRKALKLLRKRMVYNFERVTESGVIGFQSGICVRIPMPCYITSPNLNGVLRSTLAVTRMMLSVQSKGHFWFLFELLQTIYALTTIGKHNSGIMKYLSSTLRSLLMAFSSNTLSEEALVGYMTSLKTALLPYVKNASPNDSLMNYNYYGLLRVSDSENSNDMNEDNLSVVPSTLESLFDYISNVRRFNCIAVAKPPILSSNGEIENDEMDEDNEQAMSNELGKSIGSSSPGKTDGEGTLDSQVGTSLQDGEMLEGASSSDANNVTANTDAVEFGDEDFSHLTIAMQRCAITIRELLHHHLSAPFSKPIINRGERKYYKYTVNPIILSDIQTCVLQNGYNNSIYDFYADVVLFFDNITAFFPFDHKYHQSCLKLIPYFDRLFFECVLSYEKVITFAECCRYCCSPYIDDRKVAKCERCEGNYHIECLQIPLPRNEWFCPSCIEQRRVFDIHPYRNAMVMHPEKRDVIGKVVDIVQSKNVLRFVVNYSGLKVVLDSSEFRGLLVSPTVTLPSGYNIEEYDRVCAIVKGYSSWGNFHGILPGVLSESSSTIARDLSLDIHFQLERTAITLLSTGLASEEFGMKEYLTVFRAIIQRIMQSHTVADKLQELEDEAAQRLEIVLPDFEKGTISYRDLIWKRHSIVAKEGENGDNDDDDDEIKFEDDDFEDDDNGDDDIVVSKSKPKGKNVIVESDEDDDDSEIESVDDIENDGLIGDDGTDDEGDSEKKAANNNEDNVSDGDEDVVSTACSDDLNTTLDNVDDDGPDTIDKWSQRRDDRRRGIEDALFMRSRVMDALNELKVIAQEESAVDSSIGSEIGDLFAATEQKIVKACVPNIPDDISHPEEWLRGFNAKSASLRAATGGLETHTSTDSSESIASFPLCGICQRDEMFISSHFVWAFSWDDFIDFAKEGIRKGDDSRNEFYWAPVGTNEYEIEREEFAKGKELDSDVRLFKGSVCAHNYCANLSHSRRMASYYKMSNYANMQLLNVANTLGISRTLPIARDGIGNEYYLFYSLEGILVRCFDKTEEKKVYPDIDSNVGNYHWRVYTTTEDLQVLYDYLSPTHTYENSVRVVIDKLFGIKGVKKSLKLKNENVPPKIDLMPEAFFDELTNLLTETYEKELAFSGSKIKLTVSAGSQSGTAASSGSPSRSGDEVNASISVGGGDDDSEDDIEAGSNSAQDKRNVYLANSLSYCYSDSESDGERFDSSRESVRIGSSVVYIHNDVYFKGKVIDISPKTADSDVYYLVKFLENESRATWLDKNSILKAGTEFSEASIEKLDNSVDKNRKLLFKLLSHGPDILRSLRAYMFVHAPCRHDKFRPPPFSYSASTTAIELLRLAIFMVEAALPHGCIDDIAQSSEDSRWSENFVVNWRNAVALAGNAEQLMECVLMLEHGIKGAWTKSGNKVMGCMPSRAHLLRYPTISSVALKLWMLDNSISYDMATMPYDIDPEQKQFSVFTMKKQKNTVVPATFNPFGNGKKRR